MIDYAKILLPVEVGARLLRHPALAFIGKFDHTTGAVLGDSPCIAQYGPLVRIGRTNDSPDARRALQFIVYPSGRTIMEGSFHKYAQGGANHGAFTYVDFLAVVAELCDTFDLDSHTMRLLQLEAGANVEPPLPTSRTLRAIVCHREGHPFGPMKTSKGRSLGIVMQRDQYDIKIYDKGRHYGLPFDLLRFELKFKKAAPFNRLGIYTVNDLLNLDVWHRLQARVMVVYGELVIAEPSIDITSLSESQTTFVELVRAPGYWQGLTKGARHKARARYADIVARFAGSDLKAGLGRRIQTTLSSLLESPMPTARRGDHFTNIPADHLNGAREPFLTSVKGAIGPHGIPAGGAAPSKVERNRCDPANEAPVAGVRRCLTCGRDITDQRAGSSYCSEARHGKDGKRCRNAGSNPRNNHLRSLERIEREPLLFDHRPYLRAVILTADNGRPT